MIFTIQRYLEDHFRNRGLDDGDQYAIKVANLYSGFDSESSEIEMLRNLHEIRTIFYKANTGINRREFEQQLLKNLLQRYQKKTNPRKRVLVKMATS